MDGSGRLARPRDFRGLTFSEFRRELELLAGQQGWSLYATARYLKEHPESDLRVVRMAALIMAEQG